MRSPPTDPRGEFPSGAPTFIVEFAESVADDLAELRAFDRRDILDRIEEQLAHQPTEETRNRNPLWGLEPPWEHVEPIWELRIGEYGVFYDVDEEAATVTVRAVRRRPPGKTTEAIL